MINLVFCIIVYLFFVSLFLALRIFVKNNMDYFDEVPNKLWFKKSRFYITETNKKPFQAALLELLFWPLGIVSWNLIFAIIFAVLVNIRMCTWGDFQAYAFNGWMLAFFVAIILGIQYSHLFLFLPLPCITAITLSISKFERGKLLAREMLVSLIMTIIVMPFFLLSTDYYYRVDDTALYTNEYFTFQEEKFIFDDIHELVIEKICEEDGEIWGISCIIKNDVGKQSDILDPNLSFEMVQYLFSQIDFENCAVLDQAELTQKEREKLINESSENEAEIYEWFFNLGLIDIKDT